MKTVLTVILFFLLVMYGLFYLDSVIDTMGTRVTKSLATSIFRPQE